MKKSEWDFSRAVPPMPASFVKRMDDTLKEIERMKKRKKLTVAMAAAMIAVLALASVAIAQTIDSGILGRLFGSQEPPQQASELLQTNLNSVTQDGITLSMDELLFDGRSINCQWSISSEREQPVFAYLGYEIGGLDQSLFDAENSRGTAGSYNVGDNALTLLGAAGDVSAPNKSAQWLQSNFKKAIDREFTVTVSAVVYTTSLAPVSTDELYPDETLAAQWEKEGKIGVCEREGIFMARIDAYPAFTAALASSPLLAADESDADGSLWAQANINAHEESGLMKKLTELTLTVPVKPAETDESLSLFGPATFEMDDCTLVVEEVAFSPVSVTADMRIYPKAVKEGDSFFNYRVFAAARGEAWYLNLSGEGATDENGNLYYDVNLDGPPVAEIPEELTFIRVDERREGEAYAKHYARLILEAPEGMRAVMKLK